MLLVTGKVATEVPEPLTIGIEKLDDIPMPAGNVALSVTGPEKAFIGVIDTVTPS